MGAPAPRTFSVVHDLGVGERREAAIIEAALPQGGRLPLWRDAASNGVQGPSPLPAGGPYSPAKFTEN